ncbi:MAG TPA: hypothetical protein VIX89_02920 [Bryobacteraceae bacterium]
MITTIIRNTLRYASSCALLGAAVLLLSHSPVYAGGMEATSYGKHIQLSGSWGCDCATTVKECSCIT